MDERRSSVIHHLHQPLSNLHYRYVLMASLRTNNTTSDFQIACSTHTGSLFMSVEFVMWSLIDPYLSAVFFFFYCLHKLSVFMISDILVYVCVSKTGASLNSSASCLAESRLRTAPQLTHFKVSHPALCLLRSLKSLLTFRIIAPQGNHSRVTQEQRAPDSKNKVNNSFEK